MSCLDYMSAEEYFDEKESRQREVMSDIFRSISNEVDFEKDIELHTKCGKIYPIDRSSENIKRINDDLRSRFLNVLHIRIRGTDKEIFIPYSNIAFISVGMLSN